MTIPIPPARHCTRAGLDIIKKFEGLALRAYKCPAGVYTIGYGHTLTARAGMAITKAEAEALLQQDVRNFEQAVQRLITTPLNDNQFSALVSFTFNVGSTALAHSSLRRLLNRGWYSQVPPQLLRWNKANNRVLAGLTRRRQAEADLWNTPI